MEGALKRVLLKNEEQPHELLTAIRDVCRQLDAANQRFSMESDSDLIEACIYEMEALRARYRYLLKAAREQGITAAPAAAAEMNWITLATQQEKPV